MPTNRHVTDLADVLVEDYGTIRLLYPITDGAEEWAQRHVEFEEYQVISGGIVVDRRYVPPIVEAMRLDGLDVVQV